MYELLLRTEALFQSLQTPVLAAVGAVGILVGLVFWLGGTRYGAVIAGLLGALVGAVVGLVATPLLPVEPWLGVVIGAAVVGGLAILLRHILILVLAVLVISAVSGAGYLSVVLDRAVPRTPAATEAPADAPGALRPTLQYFSGMSATDRVNYMNEITREAKTFRERFGALLADTWEAAGTRGWTLILAVALGAVVGILLVWLIAKIVIALAYSLVGTAVLLLGAQAALLGAGIPAVSDLDARRWLLPITFLVMSVVGWVWQLFYGGPAKAKRQAPEEAHPSE
jgi:hypothetical protein